VTRISNTKTEPGANQHRENDQKKHYQGNTNRRSVKRSRRKQSKKTTGPDLTSGKHSTMGWEWLQQTKTSSTVALLYTWSCISNQYNSLGAIDLQAIKSTFRKTLYHILGATGELEWIDASEENVVKRVACLMVLGGTQARRYIRARPLLSKWLEQTKICPWPCR
jgi:hypothetical protein